MGKKFQYFIIKNYPDIENLFEEKYLYIYKIKYQKMYMLYIK